MRNKIYYSISVRKSRLLEMHVSAKKVEVENRVSMSKRINLDEMNAFDVVDRLANWREEMRAYGAEYVRVSGFINP